MNISEILRNSLECVKNYVDGKYNTASNNIGELNNLQTINKDNVVNAVNELNQGVNDGKELIADAIGEPLSAEDTFNDMSGDINGLLTTFKTNMMNNGVTVESGDKFKQLIDKIATLADNEGRGMQLASGTFTGELVDIEHRSIYAYGLVVTDLSFKPNLVIANAKLTDGNDYNAIGITTDFYDNNVICTYFIKGITNTSYEEGNRFNFTNALSDNGFRLAVHDVPIEATEFTWYAIGVGEEDNTLRDSLASVLEDEDVEVLEEDTMADLIVKTDEEFDRKNANKGLDIISATELPATGKENQICVITDNPVNLFYITSNYDDVYNNDDGITLYVGDSTTHDGHLGNLVTVNTNNIKHNYYIYKVLQGHTTRLSSYIYRNSQWEQLTQKSVSIMEDKAYVTGGNFIFNTSSPFVLYSTTDGLQLKGSGLSGSVGDYDGHNRSGSTLKTLINFSDFNKIRIKARHSFFTSDDYGELPTKIVAFSGTRSSTHNSVNINSVLTGLGAVDKCEVLITEARSVMEPLEFEIDISNWSGSYYLGFAIHSEDQHSGTVYISDIELY